MCKHNESPRIESDQQTKQEEDPTGLIQPDIDEIDLDEDEEDDDEETWLENGYQEWLQRMVDR